MKSILLWTINALFAVSFLVATTTITSSGNWSDSSIWSASNIGDNVTEDVSFNQNLGSIVIQTGEIYTTIPLGGIAPEVENTRIYKKQFLRRLTNGSLA